MSKVTLTDTSSGYATASQINANNALIEAAIEKCLFRDGTAPNTMSADFDMNGYEILNLPTPTTNSSAARLVDVTAASASLTTGAAVTTSVTDSSGYYTGTNVEAILQELVESAITEQGIYNQGDSNAVDRTVQEKFQDIVSVKDLGALGDGSTDDTTAFQDACDSGAGFIYVPPGTYIIDTGEISVSSNTTIFGIRGVSIIKGGSSFTTSYASEAAYKTFFKVDTKSNVHFRGLSFRLYDTSSTQAKVRFNDCDNVSMSDFDSIEDGVWDFLFNTCTNVKLSNFDIACGYSGNTGVGVRICGKSKEILIENGYIHGYLVDSDATGAGAEPASNNWASVHLNIDNGDANHLNSTGFNGGVISFTSDGTASMNWTVSGVNATDWKAWIIPDVDYSTPSNTAVRSASVAITTNTITATGLPSGSNLDYKIMYTYWGTTPENIQINNCKFVGATYSGISIINGINISISNCSFYRIGDVGVDAEGCLDIRVNSCSFNNCVGAGTNGIAYRSIIKGNQIDGSAQGIAADASAGGGYQSFNANDTTGYDYGTYQYAQDVTVGSPSGNNQTCTGSSTCFRFVVVGERLSFDDSGTTYSYEVTAKASDNEVTIDNTTARAMATAPETDTTHVLTATTYTAQTEWWKTGYGPLIYGITGGQVFSDNIITNSSSSVDINIRYGNNLKISNNQLRGTDRSILCLDSQHVNITGNLLVGRASFETTVGFTIGDNTFSDTYQRPFTLYTCDFGEVKDNNFSDLCRSGSTTVNPIVIGHCDSVVIMGNLFAKIQGDSSNGTEVVLEGDYDRDTNTVDTGTPANTHLLVEKNPIMDGTASTYSSDNTVSFTDGDTTPTVILSSTFVTANTSGTTISMFDDGVVGKEITVHIGDANTTIDFTGTHLKGNVGSDWTPTTGDHMICKFDGTDWFCIVSDNTV